MKINTLSDKIVFNILTNIQSGYLEITNHEGKNFKFGDSNSFLRANIKIKNPNFTFNLIKGGSVGLPEQYPGAKNPFEWMSEIMDLKKEKNFFETRVTEYKTGGQLKFD